MRGELIALCAGLAVVATAGCGPRYPNCDNDEDCHEGEVCVNGHCQQCGSDSDCPSGQQCVDGRCDAIPGYCNGDGDCPPGQQCRNNRCTAVAESRPPEDVETPPGVCQMNAVLFGFDQDNLDGTARDTVQANANCARDRTLGAVHLTGHADPRGTEEYNLALGDRRARAVQRYLESLGSGVNVTISSMGEEMARGTDEGSWANDRKVEFIAR